MDLDLHQTLAICGLLLAIAVFAGWRGAQPSHPLKGVRMIPWRLIMVLSTAILLPMMGRLAALAGLISPP